MVNVEPKNRFKPNSQMIEKCFILSFIFALSLTTYGQTSVRNKKSINSLWLFSKKDTLQSQSWQRVNLPYTWNADDVNDEIPGYYQGVGWYKKSIDIDALNQNRKYLWFEGANNKTTVFLNHKRVGKHKGGYTAFCFDITSYLKKGKNELLIKVDNSPDFNALPVSADYTFYGGIYRDVYLLTTAPLHFEVLNEASPGIFIKTPKVSKKRGELEISGKIKNEESTSKRVTLLTTIRDEEGKVVKTVKNSEKIKANSLASFNSGTIKIAAPKLWSPKNPYLYHVSVKIVDTNNKLIDQVSQPLGFRWFRFDADKGFFLNGKPLKLYGTSRHQDREGYGNALKDEFHEEDIKIIKDMGANFLRIAHYPQDPRILQLCDELGLLVWEEIPVVNEINPTKEFSENAHVALKEMIRQNYNHPSVIIWGFMNEVFATNKMRKKVNRDTLLRKTTTLAKSLEKLAKKEDPNRYTAMALEYTYADEYLKYGIGEVCDVVGWNLYIGWYQKGMNNFGPFLDKWHKKYPKKSFIISEFGAGSDVRIHSLNPVRFDYSIEYQEKILESYYQQIMARDYVAGGAIWNSFDFNSEGRMDVVPNINNKGLLTTDRHYKDSYYLMQAKLSDKPVLKIASENWKSRTGIELRENKGYCDQPVVVFGNGSKAELLQNGKSLGTKQFVDNKATWKVPFVDGTNRLFVTDGAQQRLTHQVNVDFHLQPYHSINGNFDQIAVNLGTKTYFTEEPGGYAWLPEKPFTKGGWGYLAADKEKDHGPTTHRFDVKQTGNDPLFYTFHKNLKAFKFDVPAGKYEVELFLVDRLSGNKFKILVNEQNVYNYPQATKEKTAVKVKDIIYTSEGQGITISFKKIEGDSFLSAVKIKKLDE